ncbi:MAG: BrnT family toxin [Gammaproteobacteria bacterium]|nr:BrnT family toxin [Gammaproteobacteria bacterium]
MEFDWDPGKRVENLQKRGLDFAKARHLFNSIVQITIDKRRDYGETRYQYMGLIDSQIVMMVYTIREDSIRIISLRKANEREKRFYQKRPETP